MNHSNSETPMESKELREQIGAILLEFEDGRTGNAYYIKQSQEVLDEATDQLLQLFQDYCEGCVPEELLLTSQTGRDMKQLVAFGYNMCRQAMLDKLEDKS